MKSFVKVYFNNIKKSFKSKYIIGYVVGIAFSLLLQYYIVSQEYYLIDDQVRQLTHQELKTLVLTETMKIAGIVLVLALVLNIFLTLSDVRKPLADE